ncbi:MAG: hypothetical protein ABI682_07985 [Acidobacteriota bacterium]
MSPAAKVQCRELTPQPSRTLTSISTLSGLKNQNAPVSSVNGIVCPWPVAPSGVNQSA